MHFLFSKSSRFMSSCRVLRARVWSIASNTRVMRKSGRRGGDSWTSGTYSPGRSAYSPSLPAIDDHPPPRSSTRPRLPWELWRWMRRVTSFGPRVRHAGSHGDPAQETNVSVNHIARDDETEVSPCARSEHKYMYTREAARQQYEDGIDQYRLPCPRRLGARHQLVWQTRRSVHWR